MAIDERWPRHDSAIRCCGTVSVGTAAGTQWTRGKSGGVLSKNPRSERRASHVSAGGRAVSRCCTCTLGKRRIIGSWSVDSIHFYSGGYSCIPGFMAAFVPAHAALRPSLSRRRSCQSLCTCSRQRVCLYAVHGRQGGHPDAEHSFRGQDAGYIVPPAEYAHMTFEQVRDARFLKKIPTLYEILGEDAVPRIPNPAARLPSFQDMDLYLAAPTDAVLKQTVVNPGKPQNFARYLRSGPREHVAFSPDEVRAAIVTCGGICPGINTVIRELTDGLANLYGVQHIYGIRGGYRGFYDGTPFMPLNPRNVDGIHRLGGTVLGTSRGGFDLERIMHAIEEHRLNQLYLIGGDGTIKGAAAIAAECERLRRKVGVVSVPKTIDNDIPVIDHSFGFMTAVEEAQRAINAAHVEVTCFPNGIGVPRCGLLSHPRSAVRSARTARPVRVHPAAAGAERALCAGGGRGRRPGAGTGSAWRGPQRQSQAGRYRAVPHRPDRGLLSHHRDGGVHEIRRSDVYGARHTAHRQRSDVLCAVGAQRSARRHGRLHLVHRRAGERTIRHDTAERCGR
eukprot:ctg_2394.g357